MPTSVHLPGDRGRLLQAPVGSLSSSSVSLSPSVSRSLPKLMELYLCLLQSICLEIETGCYKLQLTRNPDAEEEDDIHNNEAAAALQSSNQG